MRRIRLTFWLLLGTAVVSTGVLMQAVEWRASPTTGATVGIAGVTTAVAMALAARMLVVLGRGR